MSGRTAPRSLGSASLPARDAPPELVRRPRIALLAGHACWTPAPGGSPGPLGQLAGRLAAALPAGWRVVSAVHGGHPSLTDALEGIEDSDVSDLVVLSPYPCFSLPIGGEIAQELYGWIRERGRSAINLAFRGSWYDDVGYVAAQAAAVAEFASSRGLTPSDSHLLFTAGAPPPSRSVLDGHDPYLEQLERSTRLVAERLGWPADRVSVVTAGGRPAAAAVARGVSERLAELLEEPGASVLLCRLPGCGDRWAAGPRGDRVHCCPPFEEQERFVGVLRDLVLRGARPVLACRAGAAPAAAARPAAEAGDGDPTPLIMVGAEAACDALLTSAHGELLRSSEPRALLEAKPTRPALRAFLEWIRDQPAVAEAFVWDTCQRIECYAWLADPDDRRARELAGAQLRDRLFGEARDALAVNVLDGLDVWRHLMRTACGLHSRVPGDTDVLQQLHTARHIAESAGAAGPRAGALVAEAARLVERVRAETAWGSISGGYCEAALACVPALRPPRAALAQHLVIGGSTTSRSILGALRERFDVPPHQLTLVYREHHGQMKLLRTALGQGRRLRVHAYTELRVVRAIAEADVVYLGIDQAEPVLDPSGLGDLRDLAARPLTIVDFNSFGSLRGDVVPPGVAVWNAQQLDEAVAAGAAALRRRDEYRGAVAEAEACIERAAPGAALVAGGAA
jgi:glutamyl-tRNA reductase